MPASLTRLVAAVTVADCQAVHQEAHRLRSILANLSARKAANHALEVEMAAKTGETPRLQQGWQELQDEMQRLWSVLNKAGLADCECLPRRLADKVGQGPFH